MKEKLQSFRNIAAGCLLGMALVHHPANAGIVSTEEAAAAPASREHLGRAVSRPEVARQLQDLGVPPQEALSRINAMTDEEVRRIAGGLGTLPAGGALSNYELLVVLMLVIILALVL
jgi:hypothetical protein